MVQAAAAAAAAAAVALLLQVSLSFVGAARVPRSVLHLPVEHRTVPVNILAGIPEATDNSFVWRAGDGSYRFGMKGDDQWRVETRDKHGSVQGQYFYRTPNGGHVTLRFSAGSKSSRSEQLNQEELLDLAVRVGGASDVLSLSLQQLQQQEKVLPYGALKMAANRAVILLRRDDREDLQLQALITDVRH